MTELYAAVVRPEGSEQTMAFGFAPMVRGMCICICTCTCICRCLCICIFIRTYGCIYIYMFRIGGELAKRQELQGWCRRSVFGANFGDGGVANWFSSQAHWQTSGGLVPHPYGQRT